jgi:uncharacterized protein YbaA (DUF1428 family)
MSYIDGFVIPVPAEKRQAYIKMAKDAQAIYLEYGALRVVESWGDDLPKGKINDFHTAIVAEGDEAVIFSWVEWPDKATRDAANQKIMADPRMQPGPDLPFSGARVIYGGFSILLDTNKK